MLVLWLLYAVAVSLVLCVAAVAAERGLRLLDLPARGVWLAAMAGGIGLPLSAYFVGPLSLHIGTWLGSGGLTEAGSAGVAGTGLTETLRTNLTSMGGRSGTGGVDWAPIAVLQDIAASLEGPLFIFWIAVSAILLVRLAIEGVWLHRGQQWQQTELHGRTVLVTEEDGPALAGVLRPVILVPEWFFELSADLRELALRHEEAHRSAGDPWLVLGAEIARALLPWNPGVHWAAERLRRATELDCDRRLLQDGTNPARYGRLLVTVGSRSLGPSVAGRVALGERTSDLRRRITMLRQTSESWTPLRLAGVAVVILAGVALACEMPVPPVEEKPPAEPQRDVRQVATSDEGSDVLEDALHPDAPGAPLVVVDGEAANEPLDLNALSVERVEVVKGEAATRRYGRRAANGVVRIKTTEGNPSTGIGSRSVEPRTPSHSNSPSLRALTGSGEYQRPKGVGTSPLIIVDGAVIGSRSDLEEFSERGIERIEVVKGQAARALYGDRARDGVIQITTSNGG